MIIAPALALPLRQDAPAKALPGLRKPLPLVLALLLAVLVCVLPMQAAQAARLALLVGVSNYPALDAKLQLEGPRNDIPLIRSVLERRGFKADDMQVLADGVAGARDPSRNAVLGAMDQLVAKARAGDFVFIYFAGHGSQMPADRNTPQGRRETDGLHEIFLPRDVGKWDDKVGVVQNAIANHELVDRLDALTSKGVFVWAIFDACHSATLMRSAGDPEVRYRHLQPDALGIPKARLDAAEADALKTRGTDSAAPVALEVTERGKPTGNGGFVAFYAAQTTETTPEMRLPAGHPDRKPYGLFGFTLAEALSSVDGVSYRQLSQHVLQRYAAMNMNAPTPAFSGTHLDAPIFGSSGGTLIRQWPIDTSKGITIQAGILNQVSEGSMLAVVPGALSRNEDAIGYLRVDKAEVLSATLVPTDYKGKPVLSATAIPAGAQARLIDPQVSFTLRVLAPNKAAARPGAQFSSADYNKVMALLDAIQKNKPAGVEVRLVPAGQEHDLRLIVEDGKLWMVSPSGQFYADGPNKTPSVAINQGEFEAKVQGNLQAIGKAVNLLRLSSTLGAAAGATGGTLEVGLTLNRKGKPPMPLTASAAMSFVDGDVIEVTLRNKGRAATDITALYIDADYGISVLYPYQSGIVNRLEAGATLSFKIDIHDDTTGLERMVLIGVEARAGSVNYDFSFMQQAKVERTRGEGEDDTGALFRAAGFGDDPSAPVTRGGKAQLPGRTQMQVLPFRVQGR